MRRLIRCFAMLLILAAASACGHGGSTTPAYRAGRWQTLEASGCRIGTIEGAGEFETRCYQCPDGGKVCI